MAGSSRNPRQGFPISSIDKDWAIFVKHELVISFHNVYLMQRGPIHYQIIASKRLPFWYVLVMLYGGTLWD
ncbi:MAG: hypothetical protein EAX81_01125 [Candidatus Thorarchaeota archaeon]|nr:hypothetical protein [Candidatus Thorarchaeota archaeon]